MNSNTYVNPLKIRILRYHEKTGARFSKNRRSF